MQMFHQSPEKAEISKHQADSESTDNVSLKEYELKQIAETLSTDDLYEKETHQKKVKIRATMFFICLTLLVIGRCNIPDIETSVFIDKPQIFFQFVNDFINTNTFWRNTMQIICSVFMDAMFLATGINWILRGNSSRLVVSVVSFYLIRALVQSLSVSPFPADGYWWDDPGFPSLVVPYGRGSDFFFSGHVGFVTICATEWKRNGNKLMARILAVGGVYTAFILLTYKVHYSIDLFAGVTFAHWVYMIVDQRKEKIDSVLIRIYYNIINSKGRLSLLYKSPQEVEQKLYNGI